MITVVGSGVYDTDNRILEFMRKWLVDFRTTLKAIDIGATLNLNISRRLSFIFSQVLLSSQIKFLKPYLFNRPAVYIYIPLRACDLFPNNVYLMFPFYACKQSRECFLGFFV